MFPKLSETAVAALNPFATTYLCDSGFTGSTLLSIKMKSRNRLNAQGDMCCYEQYT